jgi:hypothetical protein
MGTKIVMNKRILTNFFIIFMLVGAYGTGLFEKSISRGFDSEPYMEHPLFKDDTRSLREIGFWPFSSYPMFSDPYHTPSVFRIEARGITSSGEEIVLNISKTFYPLWENGLHRALKRSIALGKDPKSLLESLTELYHFRFIKNKWYDNQRDQFPKVVAINWYYQLWEWEAWLDFRKWHSNLFTWKDFKTSPFTPKYHRLYFSSGVKHD